MGYVIVWPKASVFVKDKRVVLEKGDQVPDGVSDVDIANLVIIGAVAGSLDEAAEDAGPKEGTVKYVLAEVDGDPEKAQAALDEEKAGENRPSLVSKLEAIIGSGS